ncbi:MAG TPA: phage holin family protein [Gaiellaceae bacterium]
MRNGNHPVGSAAKIVAEHASALTKLELELAALEVKKKALALGVGIGLGVGAAVFGLLGICFALATGTAALTLVFSVWISLLIMTGVLFLVAGVLGVLAVGKLRRGAPPVPETAIREAKATTQAIKR